MLRRLFKREDPKANISKADSPNPETPNIYDNFRTSAIRLEQFIHEQLKNILDPYIYNMLIAAAKDEKGHYAVVINDKEDMIYYYQKLLNLLIDFKKFMEPISDLHDDFISKMPKSLLAKLKLAVIRRNDLNDVTNKLKEAYEILLQGIQDLELDVLLSQLPDFSGKEVKKMFLQWLPLQAAIDQFLKNPFVAHTRTHGRDWLTQAGVSMAPLQQTGEIKEEEADEAFSDSPPKNMHEMKHPATAAPAGDRRATMAVLQESALKVLHDLSLPSKLENLSKLLTKMLTDLKGSEIPESVQQTYEGTIHVLTQMIEKLNKFLQKPYSLTNTLSFVYRLYPQIKALISSLPQSGAAIFTIMKENALISLRQFNWLVRDLFLYLDYLESKFYLKDGFLLHLNQGSRCGFFLMDVDPTLSTRQNVLDAMLGENDDAYAEFNGDLYYINRYKKKSQKTEVEAKSEAKEKANEDKLPAAQNGKAKERQQRGINVKKLTFTAPEHGFRKLLSELEFSSDRAELKNGYGCLCPQLTEEQLQLITAQTRPEGLTLTGRYREPRLYHSIDLSLAHMAENLQEFMNSLGYAPVEDERYPYAESYRAQRAKLYTEEQHRELKSDGNGPQTVLKTLTARNGYRLHFLKQRTEANLSEDKEERLKKDKEKQRKLLLSRQKRVGHVIEERMKELQAEIDKRGAIKRRLLKTKKVKKDLLDHLKEASQQKESAHKKFGDILQDCAFSTRNQRLLRDGRTGHLLSLLEKPAIPSSRNDLIACAKAQLEQEGKKLKYVLFFPKRRKSKLNERIRLVQELQSKLSSNCRLNDYLRDLQAKNQKDYLLLVQESKLMANLILMDKLIPDEAFDLKPINVGDHLLTIAAEKDAPRRQSLGGTSRPLIKPSLHLTLESGPTLFPNNGSANNANAQGTRQSELRPAPPIPPKRKSIVNGKHSQ